MDNAKTCRFGFIHVIEQGDTLYKLGKRYGVTVSALLFANPWVNVYNLQIGDELCIPDFGCRRCKDNQIYNRLGIGKWTGQSIFVP